jgi:hypothetical protein
MGDGRLAMGDWRLAMRECSTKRHLATMLAILNELPAACCLLPAAGMLISASVLGTIPLKRLFS